MKRKLGMYVKFVSNGSMHCSLSTLLKENRRDDMNELHKKFNNNKYHYECLTAPDIKLFLGYAAEVVNAKLVLKFLIASKVWTDVVWEIYYFISYCLMPIYNII